MGHHPLGLSMCPVTSTHLYLLCLVPVGLCPSVQVPPVPPSPLAPGSSSTLVLLLQLPDNSVASSLIACLATGLHSW